MDVKKSKEQKVQDPVAHPSWKLNFHLSVFGLTSLYGWLPFVAEGMGISGFFASTVIVVVKFGLHIKQSDITEMWLLRSSCQRCWLFVSGVEM